MKRNLLFFVMALNFSFLFAQMEFTEKILIQKDIVPEDINDFQILDFDQDGLLDIITLSGEGNKKISFYHNEGNDVFTHEVLISDDNNFSNTNQYFLKVVDINDDGYYDLITNGTDSIVVFINDGQNQFIEIILGYGISSGKYTNIAVSDIDNDGVKDIIAESKLMSSNSRVFWFKNDNLNFYPFEINIGIKNPTFADYDNDSDLDILYKNNSGNIGLITNNTGVFSEQQLFTVSNFNFNEINLLDFDNDGLKDVVLYDQHSPNGIKLYKKNTNNTYDSISIYSGEFDYVTFFDYDNDNDIDIFLNKRYVSHLSSSRIYINNSLIFTNEIDINDGLELDDGNNNYFTGDKVEFQDINSDNRKDLIYSTDSRIGYFKNLSNNSFSSKIVADNSLGIAILADINNDNKIDIVLKEKMPGREGKVSWFQNLGSNLFSQIKLEENSGDEIGISAGDIDNDGDLDILSGTWLYTLQEGEITDKRNPSPGMSISQLTDFDSDNDLDILGVHFNSLKLLKNNSNGTSFVIEDLIAGLNVNEFKIIDFDNDNDYDILTTTGLNSALRINTNNTFSNLNLGTSLNNSFDMADIDNDGDIDIVGADDYNLKILFNDGSNNFNIVNILSNIYYPTIDDIDNDGDLDIIGYDAINKRTVLLLNNNLNFSQINVGNYIRDFDFQFSQLTAYVVQDINADGYKEILMSSVNEVIVFYNNESLSNLNIFFTNRTIKLFPNPVFDFIHIYPESKNYHFQIYDMNGRMQKISYIENRINVENLAPGTYVLQILTDKNHESRIFIKK